MYWFIRFVNYGWTGYTSYSSPNNSVHDNFEFANLPLIKEINHHTTTTTRENLMQTRVKDFDFPWCEALTFCLTLEDQLLGLPVGKHIFLCTTINDKLCMRAYTPTSSVDEVGFSELVIKVYFKACTPSSQTEDSCLNIWTPSPLGHIEYTARGNFLVHRKQRFAKRLAMLANGTGITPIYQVAQTILKDPEDRTKMHEVYANRPEDEEDEDAGIPP